MIRSRLVRHTAVAVVLLAAALLPSGAGHAVAAGPKTARVPTSARAAAAVARATTAATTTAATTSTTTATPRVTKVLVVVVENHSLAQMRHGMPYTAGLATRRGYTTDYRAVRHPSLPNYLAITGGGTFGVADDDPPSAHPLHGSSVFGQALRAGRTARVYADGMPTACSRSNGGDHYAVRHNPWTYFVDERSRCLADDVPYTRFGADVRRGRLPSVGLVVPNTCHDAHDCSLATADAWFHRLMHTVVAGPDWRSGRLAVVLTADEDDRRSGNRVLTVVAQRSLHHRVARHRLGHYSLTRLYDRVAGVPLLRNARTAPSLATAFGLRL